ncbi:MAG: SGNH/GDSL hydrolase family protein [Phycisphaerae bacterium]|nr:SGNH/GDSL hydrolase family protein [Phycisphaerae bacterium]
MQEPTRETIEWCNFRWQDAPDRMRRRVLLIGDSIVAGYHPVVVEELEGVVNVDMLATSKAIDDPAIIKETRYVMEGYRHAIVHFNNGLHGWHLDDEGYRQGLREYVRVLRDLAGDARLIWASSTPISAAGDMGKLCEERNPRVVARNRMAAEIMREAGIPIDDLYGLVVGRADLRSEDSYHYVEKGRRVQGQAVAEVIRRTLGDIAD